MMRNPWFTAALAVALSLPAARAMAKDWVVASGATGSGTAEAPLGSVEDALLVAGPGDIITVRAGTYYEMLRTVRDGTAEAPITLRSDGKGQVLLSAPGTVLSIQNSFVLVAGLVLDGEYGPHETVDIASQAHSVVLRDLEVRRSGRDCINVGSTHDVLIDRSLIHHCLDTAGGGDAHGIVASAVSRLTIRDTEIHTFSGDAVQLNRQHTATSPGWDEILIEGCRFWLAPLARAEHGIPAGAVPGENAVDTKISADAPRARITIRDTEAWGFRNGRLALQGAFNLKEKIDATLDRVTVWDSEIAFRLRGSRKSPNGAWVTVENTVVHDVDVAFRYEDDIAPHLRVWNVTLGHGIGRAFRAAASERDGLDVRNVLVAGDRLPEEAAGATNLVVEDSAFVDAASHDYRLAAGSPAIDAGTRIPEVTTDCDGVIRPRGEGYDVGAYECVSACGSRRAASGSDPAVP